MSKSGKKALRKYCRNFKQKYPGAFTYVFIDRFTHELRHMLHFPYYR